LRALAESAQRDAVRRQGAVQQPGKPWFSGALDDVRRRGALVVAELP